MNHTEIEPGTSLKIVGGKWGHPGKATIRFRECLRSRRFHSVWIAESDGRETLAKVATLQPPEESGLARLNAFYAREFATHAVRATTAIRRFTAVLAREAATQDELLWVNGYGVWYDSSLFSATFEAKGLEMVPDNWVSKEPDSLLANEMLLWQASWMGQAPKEIFPDGIDCYELEGGTWCLVYPCTRATTLAERTTRQRPEDLTPILLSLAAKLHALESEHRPHQDLKPEHVLILDNGELRLLDPGYRELKEEGRYWHFYGDLSWPSPGLRARSEDYPRSFVTTPRYYPLLRHTLNDCQSLAVIIYECWTRSHPFDGAIWDDFPKSLNDTLVPNGGARGGAFTEEELLRSRMDFINSMPRLESEIPEPWWNLVLDLLHLQIGMGEAASRMGDLIKGEKLRLGRLASSETEPASPRLSRIATPPQSRPKPVGSGMLGSLASEALEAYLEVGPADRAIPRMPEQIVDLLRTCFQVDPNDRPDMEQVVALLLGACRQVGGKTYPRTCCECGGPLPELKDFVVEKLLGKGDYGAVYLARRNTDGLPVALEIVPKKAPPFDDAWCTAQREIEFRRSLRHENIVNLVDHGMTSDWLYLATEFCNGGTAEQLMQRQGGTLPLHVAADLTGQTLQGLAYLHRQNIVHRGLKPGVLLIAEDPQPVVKISGFTSARNWWSLKCCEPEVCLGTPAFMPREQVANFRFVKPTADMWSVGATFYYMLTGQFPRDFPHGRDIWQVVLVSPVVPIRNRNASIPQRVADVIDRAMAEKPQDRYQNAEEMLNALRAAV